VLEQGPYLYEEDYSHDEIKYTIEPGLTIDPKVQPITYRKSEADPARQQPTATIQALAYRAADYAIRAAKRGDLS